MGTGYDGRKLFAREYAYHFHILPKKQSFVRQPISAGDEEVVELPLAVSAGLAMDLEASAPEES